MQGLRLSWKQSRLEFYSLLFLGYEDQKKIHIVRQWHRHATSFLLVQVRPFSCVQPCKLQNCRTGLISCSRALSYCIQQSLVQDNLTLRNFQHKWNQILDFKYLFQFKEYFFHSFDIQCNLYINIYLVFIDLPSPF